MTLLLLFVILVWLKIVAGTTIVLFWLWLVRDRGWRGGFAALNYGLVFLFWLAPWLFFVSRQASLYRGTCGLRQGMHACGLAEYLWTGLGWARFGFLLDVSLLVGIVFLIARAHVARRSDVDEAGDDTRKTLERPA
jgi:hypothetical protein